MFLNDTQLTYNGIKLKADRLYKRFGDGGLILGCVMYQFIFYFFALAFN